MTAGAKATASRTTASSAEDRAQDFVRSLFSSLPDDAEPVVTIALEREWRREARDAWWLAERKWFALDHLWRGIDAFVGLHWGGHDLLGLGCKYKARVMAETLRRNKLAAEFDLLRTPAPTREALRWKKTKAKWWLEYGKDKAPAVAAAIAADEARLAGRVKLGAGVRP